jgi:hypothetical protein
MHGAGGQTLKPLAVGAGLPLPDQRLNKAPRLKLALGVGFSLHLLTTAIGTSATWSLVRLGDVIGGITDIAQPRGIGRK